MSRILVHSEGSRRYGAEDVPDADLTRSDVRSLGFSDWCRADIASAFAGDLRMVASACGASVEEVADRTFASWSVSRPDEVGLEPEFWEDRVLFTTIRTGLRIGSRPVRVSVSRRLYVTDETFRREGFIHVGDPSSNVSVLLSEGPGWGGSAFLSAPLVSEPLRYIRKMFPGDGFSLAPLDRLHTLLVELDSDEDGDDE